MSNWSLLPTEIQEIIFHSLNVKGRNSIDLAHCALTCRDWKHTAQKTLFSTITLTSERGIEQLICSLFKFSSRPLGNLVKRIECGSKPQFGCTAMELFTFSTLFPCLEDLALVLDDESYFFLYQMLVDGAFSILKVLPTPFSGNADELYVRCLKVSKNRVTTIEIRRDDAHQRDIIKLLENQLEQFTSLKFIKVFASLPNYPSIVDYVESIKTTPIQQLFLTLKPRNDEQLLSENSSVTKPMLTVKHLILSFSHLRKNAIFKLENDLRILYLMEKFPNLEKLIIEGENQDLVSEITPSETSLSSDVFLHFLKYLFIIRDCSVPCIVANGDVNNVIKQLYSTLDQKMISSLQNCFKITPTYADPMLLSEHASKNSAIINFEQSSFMKERTIRMEFRNESYDLMCLDFIEQVGRFFDKLIFTSSRTQTTPSYLNHILKYCTRLKYLTIIPSIKPAMFEHLTVPVNYCLKNLELEEHSLTATMFQFISNHLPCLETLVLDRCVAPTSDNYFEFHAPKLSLKHLKLKFNVHTNILNRIKSNQSDRFEKIYIKLLTCADEKVRYSSLDASEELMGGDDSDDDEIQFCGFGRIITVLNMDPNPSEAGYANSIDNKICLTYFIRCAAVEEFTVDIFD